MTQAEHGTDSEFARTGVVSAVPRSLANAQRDTLTFLHGNLAIVYVGRHRWCPNSGALVDAAKLL